MSDQNMLAEVLEGLQQPQKTLPSKYFYDERGSELFDEITRLEEYYLTRTESDILKQNIKDISSSIGRQAVVIELGSGSSKKTRLLLDHLDNIAAYIPVDISENYLLKIVNTLKKEYPKLLIKPVYADYTRPFEIPEIEQPYKRYVMFFPGSTIGNFSPPQARRFLQMISNITASDGGLLIGVDLKKEQTILERAYNDKAGVTAEFNKNILIHLNRELNANFNIDSFTHKAFYNKEKGCIEMHLISKENQSVQLCDHTIALREEESIHTESSYKYSLCDFKKLAEGYFSVKQIWTDSQNLFSVQYLEKE